MSALARWDGFLAQIEGRHREVLAEGEAAARTAVAALAAGGDDTTLSHQLSAVESRLQDLETKIIDTWHAKVSDTISEEGHADAVRDACYAKGEALKHHLDDAREELRVRVLSELARQRRAHALAQHGPVPCDACRATINAPESFRALELRCSACGTITVWQPPPLMVSVAAIGTHPMAQEGALVEWRAMRAAERALHAVRPPRTLALIQTVEATQIAYWRTYLAIRAWFEPELARDPAMEIRKRMQQWYDAFASQEEAWVRAGSPRAC
jgi:hypothetical protein